MGTKGKHILKKGPRIFRAFKPAMKLRLGGSKLKMPA
jgi:hypothetical protein